MFISSFNNNQNILRFFPHTECVFDFIAGLDDNIADGRYDISNGIYAVVQTCLPKKKNERFLETHDKYVDLQYVMSGYDRIGMKNFNDNMILYKKYDSEKDISFFSDKPDFYIKLKKNDFALFFSGDAHAPLCGAKRVKKCIVKIPKNIFNEI